MKKYLITEDQYKATIWALMNGDYDKAVVDAMYALKPIEPLSDKTIFEIVNKSQNVEGELMLPFSFAREIERRILGDAQQRTIQALNAGIVGATTLESIRESDRCDNCNRHPDAPHGFDRTASHSAGRYVCLCENWTPGEAS